MLITRKKTNYCKGPKQGLDDTTLTAEKNIQLILLKITKKIVWASVIMELIVVYLLIVQKLLNLKQKVLKL